MVVVDGMVALLLLLQSTPMPSRKFQHAFRCIDDGVRADRGGHVYTTLRGTVR